MLHQIKEYTHFWPNKKPQTLKKNKKTQNLKKINENCEKNVFVDNNNMTPKHTHK